MTTATPIAPAPGAAEPARGTPEYMAKMSAIYDAAQGIKPQVAPVAPAVTPDPVAPAAPAPAAVKPAWLPEKFWDPKTGTANYEGLAKSYAEAEKRGVKPTPDPAAPVASETPPVDGADPVADDAAVDAVSAAGLNWDTLGDKIVATGTLEDTDFAALEKAGIPKVIVDRYIENLTEVREARLDRTATYLATTHGDGKDGEAMLTQVLDWAKTNLDQAQRAHFNALLAGQNTWRGAVDSLADMYKNSNPLLAEGKQALGGGGGSGGVAGFSSLAEQIKAQSDPRYKTDVTYRNTVRARIAQSQF